ncbi:MAG: hypothetical protein HQ568_05745 [Calditrichaeota bacterium]|nr:hypothetical protein [Calditrichota bacterium]
METKLTLLLLIIGIFLFLVGTFFFFRPKALIKWNAIGNIWIGESEGTIKKHSIENIFLALNYMLFTKHRTTGGVLWALSVIFLVIYFVGL